MQDINFPEIWPDVFCVYRKVNHPSFLGTFWYVTRVLIFSLCCDVLHRSPTEKWNVLVNFKVYKCTSMHVIIFQRQYRVYLSLIAHRWFIHRLQSCWISWYIVLNLELTGYILFWWLLYDTSFGMLSCARKQPHIFSLVLIGTCIYMNYNCIF